MAINSGRSGWGGPRVYEETASKSLSGSNGLVLKAVVGFGLSVRLSARGARVCVCVCVCYFSSHR